MNPTINNKTVYLYSVLFAMLLISMALLVLLPLHRQSRIAMVEREYEILLEQRETVDSIMEKDAIGADDKTKIIDILGGEKALKYNLTEAEKVKIMQLLNK